MTALGARAPETLILLSTYNGERYVEEQIESIRAQSLREWKLLIRDDRSTDETVKILRRLAARDERIELLLDGAGSLGPWASFGALIKAAAERSATFIFFADQDDVWKPDKVAAQLALLRMAERSNAGRPALVHSDLEVVDAELRTLHPSFEVLQRLSYDRADPLATLLLHNAVVGCTIAINRPLLELAHPLPRESAHDWWLALCAAVAGTIHRVPEPMVRYRQHSSNAVGVRHRRSLVKELVAHPLMFAGRSFNAFKVGVDQAQQLLERGTSWIPADRAARLAGYCAAFGTGSFSSRLAALRSSGASPRRASARVILYGILAAYPRVFPSQR